MRTELQKQLGHRPTDTQLRALIDVHRGAVRRSVDGWEIHGERSASAQSRALNDWRGREALTYDREPVDDWEHVPVRLSSLGGQIIEAWTDLAGEITR